MILIATLHRRSQNKYHLVSTKRPNCHLLWESVLLNWEKYILLVRIFGIALCHTAIIYPPLLFFSFRGNSTPWPPSPQRARSSSLSMIHDLTQRRITVGRTPLDEWSARRRDFYPTTYNTHNRHPCTRWDTNAQSQQTSGRRISP